MLEGTLSKQSQTSSNLIPTQDHPLPYKDAKSEKFEKRLIILSTTVLKYENPGLLDEVMRSLPLEDIYGHAEEDFQMETAKAQSIGDERIVAWGYQDFVIRRLLRYISILDFTVLRMRLTLPCQMVQTELFHFCKQSRLFLMWKPHHCQGAHTSDARGVSAWGRSSRVIQMFDNRLRGIRTVSSLL